MAKTLTLLGETFLFPENKQEAGWGEQATAWVEAANDALQNVAGTGDILLTSASIANGQVTAADIPGFYFDIATVRASIAEFSIHRKTTGPNAERVEAGQLYIARKDSGSFEFTQVGNGTSGVTLSITGAGQVQYISDTMSGTYVDGVIKFRMRALPL